MLRGRKQQFRLTCCAEAGGDLGETVTRYLGSGTEGGEGGEIRKSGITLDICEADMEQVADAGLPCGGCSRGLCAS